MTQVNYQESADFIQNNLRLKTFPVAVKFLEDKSTFPEKTRQPSMVLGKRITICQGVTMARTYGWTVGLTKEDLICVPAMIAFGMSGAADPAETLGKLFCEVDFSQTEETGRKEVEEMVRLENAACEAIVQISGERSNAANILLPLIRPNLHELLFRGWEIEYFP
jgi:uncharacterized protein (DUF169 family)